MELSRFDLITIARALGILVHINHEPISEEKLLSTRAAVIGILGKYPDTIIFEVAPEMV